MAVMVIDEWLAVMVIGDGCYGYRQAGDGCYGYRQIIQPEPHSMEDEEKQMDQGSEHHIPSGNEPQSSQPLNLLPSEDLRILPIS